MVIQFHLSDDSPQSDFNLAFVHLPWFHESISPLVLIRLHAHYQLTSFLPKLDIFFSICLLSQLYPLSVLDKHSSSQQGYCIQLFDVCSAQRLQQSGQVELKFKHALLPNPYSGLESLEKGKTNCQLQVCVFLSCTKHH